MTLKEWSAWIGPIAQFTTVGAAIAGLVGWGFYLQYRVSKLETQVEALLLSPRVSAGQPSTSVNQPSSSIAASCATLAEKFVTALAEHSKYGDGAAVGTRSLMSDIGCMETPKK
jgi:hypothetical protein